MADFTLSQEQGEAIEWLTEKFYKNEMRSTLVNLSRIKVKIHECNDFTELKLNKEEIGCIRECIERVIAQAAVQEEFPEYTSTLKKVIESTK